MLLGLLRANSRIACHVAKSDELTGGGRDRIQHRVTRELHDKMCTWVATVFGASKLQKVTSKLGAPYCRVEKNKPSVTREWHRNVAVYPIVRCRSSQVGEGPTGESNAGETDTASQDS
jgi:hypothetical protein